MSRQPDEPEFSSCPSFEAGLQAVDAQTGTQQDDPGALDTMIEALWVSGALFSVSGHRAAHA